VRAGGDQPSYTAGAEALRHLAELSVPRMQVQRVTQETGEELVAERDERVALHRRGDLVSECQPSPPPIACVEVDGGRMFTRAAGTGRGVHQAQWKEDKIGCLWRMDGASYETDPHPALPRCFQDETHMRQLVRGLHGEVGAGPQDDGEDERFPPEAELLPERPLEDSESAPHDSSGKATTSRWQPERIWRTCVATLRDVHAFGWMVAAEAKRRGFYESPRPVFLGDGDRKNWTVQQTHFPHFTAVLDFVHVVGHLFSAAEAVTSSHAAKWEQYLEWATAAWQGRVGEILADLERWQRILDDPPENPSPGDPAEVVRRTLGYLTNNRHRMNYPEYRRQGLPITSALVESLIKQFNRRVKGTEKFWNRPEGAEAILQVKAALLSDGNPLHTHLQNRPVSPHHRYRKRSPQKT